MKTALEDISRGNFKGALKRIEAKELELNSRNSLKLVISCCAVCNKNECKTLVEDISSLLRVCAANIEELDESLLKNYLQSIFHIMKYLVEKDLLSVLILENVLIPKFLPPKLTEKHSEIYGYITNVIYNAVLRRVELKGCIEAVTLDASYVSLKMFAKVASTPAFLERLCQYCRVFIAPNIDFNLLSEFFDKCLLLLQTSLGNKQKSDSTFAAFLSIVNILIKRFTRQLLCEQQQLETLIDKMLDVLARYCSSKQQFLLQNVLKVMSKFICSIPAVADLKIAYEDFKNGVKLYGLTDVYFVCCTTISLIFRQTCQLYYKNMNAEIWNKAFTPQLQVILYKILKHAAVIIEKRKFSCTTCENCKIKTALCESADLIFIILCLCKFSVTRHVNYKEFIKQALECAELGCARIEALKHSDCLSWKQAWSEIGCTFYNLCVNLYSLKDPEVVLYFYTFIKYLTKLEGTKTSIIKANVLDTCLSCLFQMHMRSKAYRDAMKICVFKALLNPENSEVFSYWIQAKAETDEKEITIVETFSRAKAELKELMPDLELTKETCAKLLSMELEKYKSHWPSRIPMLSTFKELQKYVDPTVAAKTFVRIWSTSNTYAHEGLLEVLNNVIKTVKKTGFEDSIILGCLYFCRYKYETEEIVCKNSADLKKMTAPIKHIFPPYDVTPHPNDECDVELSQHITCESQIKRKRLLDKASELFKKCDEHLISEHVDFLRYLNFSEVLRQMAHEYKLHCSPNNYIHLWMIQLKLSQLAADDLQILEALTPIIEFVDIRSEFAKQFLNSADKMLAQLHGLEYSARKWEVIADYYITMSLKNLELESTQVAFEQFKEAQNAYDEILKTSDNEIIKAKLHYLHFKFVLLPCEYRLINHKEDTIIKILQAFYAIREYFKGVGQRSSYVISLLFDITHALGSWFLWQRLPREVRCYTRDVAVLSQQLVSPLRAARFLVLLARADYLSCRFDDCKAKVFAIATILCLPKLKMETAEQVVEEDLGVMDVLAEDFEEMCLDLPVKSNRVVSSPVCFKESFQLPAILNHPVSCKKYCCSSLEYQELIVMKGHLEALMSIYNSDGIAEINDYFSGALRMIKRFTKRSGNAVTFWEVHVNVLLDYGNVMLRIGKKKSAKIINDQLQGLIVERKLQNLYLCNEVQLQKLNIEWELTPTLEMTEEEEEEAVVTSGTSPRTPETKISKVTINRTPSPNLLPIPVISGRKLQFNFVDNEDTNQPTTSKLKTPMKTPHVAPKIKIYTPAMATTARKNKKSTVIKHKEPIEHSAQNPTNSARKDPRAELLRSKAKLFKEKLKKEVKEKENGMSANKSLLNDLAEAEAKKDDSTEAGASKGATVRKSSRAVKKLY